MILTFVTETMKQDYFDLNGCSRPQPYPLLGNKDMVFYIVRLGT